MLSIKITNFLNFLNQKKYPFYFFMVGVFFVIYAVILNQIKTYTKLKESNFNSFLKSEEFNNIKELVFENIKSPYKEYNYTVENNDTLEKVLKKYSIDNVEINNLTGQIVKKKLSNISAGSQIQIITKEDKVSKKVISLFYPIDAITSVEVRRNQDIFDVTKITIEQLKLNKDEI